MVIDVLLRADWGEYQEGENTLRVRRSDDTDD